MAKFTQYATVAAKEALLDSGCLGMCDEDRERTVCL